LVYSGAPVDRNRKGKGGRRPARRRSRGSYDNTRTRSPCEAKKKTQTNDDSAPHEETENRGTEKKTIDGKGAAKKKAHLE